MASARKKSSSKSQSVAGKRLTATRATASRASGPAARATATSPHFAVCVRNDNYRASLQLRKLYAVLDDDFADQHQMIRIVDESGEDYLYPETYFVRVDLPRAIERALVKIA